MIAMKTALTKNRQYRGGGKMPCLGISAIKCPTTELLATVMRLLNNYSRIYSDADRREVAVDYSVHRLVDSLDRGMRGYGL